MPNFGSSRNESSPLISGALPSTLSKATHPGFPEQECLFERDADSQAQIQTPHYNYQGQMNASFVMGTVEGDGNSHPTNLNATEMLWQYRTQVGDDIVFHHLKKDDKGRLSFFRAVVSRQSENAAQGGTTTEFDQNNVPNQTVNCNFTDVPSALQGNEKGEGRRHKGESENSPINSYVAPEVASALGSSSPNVEPSLSDFGADAASEPSARSAIGVGLAVNLLALTVGGYMLQFAPSGETNGLNVAREQHQGGKEAIAASESVALNSAIAPEATATVEWRQSLTESETEARSLLQQAYNRAIARDFLGALDYLRQIRQETSVYQLAQTKIVEYTEKQRYKLEVEAYQLLQQAYNRAQDRDFTAALDFIQQIPKGTLAYAQVPKKVVEYSQKQRQLAETLEAASQPLLPRNSPSTSLEISQHPQLPTLFPSVGTSAIAPGLNPGELLQEVAPHPNVFTFPEKQVDG